MLQSHLAVLPAKIKTLDPKSNVTFNYSNLLKLGRSRCTLLRFSYYDATAHT